MMLTESLNGIERLAQQVRERGKVTIVHDKSIGQDVLGKLELHLLTSDENLLKYSKELEEARKYNPNCYGTSVQLFHTHYEIRAMLEYYNGKRLILKIYKVEKR